MAVGSGRRAVEVIRCQELSQSHLFCAARSTRGATIKLKIIKNYDNGQVDGKCGAIDPAGAASSTRFSISLKLYIDSRQLLGCAFNENLFYAICDGVGCQVISVGGSG